MSPSFILNTLYRDCVFYTFIIEKKKHVVIYSKYSDTIDDELDNKGYEKFARFEADKLRIRGMIDLTAIDFYIEKNVYLIGTKIIMSQKKRNYDEYIPYFKYFEFACCYNPDNKWHEYENEIVQYKKNGEVFRHFIRVDGTNTMRCEKYSDDLNLFITENDDNTYDCKEYYDEKLLKRYFQKNNKLEGIASQMFENGKIACSTTYKNGIRSGKYTEYYETGSIKIDCMIENDKLHGYYKKYFPNGYLQVKAETKNGLLSGLYKEYNESGGEKVVCFYYVNNE